MAAAVPAVAALRPGAAAPDFTTRGAVAGKVFTLHLKEQLRHGPVVLYFFPAAFTSGCSAEARAFAEKRELWLHGWVYDIRDGHIKTLLEIDANTDLDGLARPDKVLV
jgi:hypothetical protein